MLFSLPLAIVLAATTPQQRRTVVGCHECGWSDRNEVAPGGVFWNADEGFTHYNFSLLTQINFHSATRRHLAAG